MTLFPAKMFLRDVTLHGELCEIILIIIILNLYSAMSITIQ